MRYSPDKHSTLAHAALGAAAGLAGTLVLQAVMKGSNRLVADIMPPLRADPGEHMVHQAERVLPSAVASRIPQAAETVAARSLHLGYGMTFGMLYSLLRPRGGSVLVNGAILGIATWAAGYLGWLPAIGLTRPIWQHRPRHIIAPIAQHAAYGMASVAAYDTLHELI